MTRRDKILIIGIVAISLTGLAWANRLEPSHKPCRAVIRVQGEVVETVDLTSQSDRKKIRVRGPLGVSLLEVEKGKIRMVSSPCPDKICIRQGWADQPGETIVCVPNGISVSVEGDGGVDAIIR